MTDRCPKCFGEILQEGKRYACNQDMQKEALKQVHDQMRKDEDALIRAMLKSSPGYPDYDSNELIAWDTKTLKPLSIKDLDPCKVTDWVNPPSKWRGLYPPLAD